MKKKTAKDVYAEHLKSKSWLWLRREVLHRDDFRCVECGSGRSVEVHHLEYDGINPCNVPMEKLVTLCATCHRMTHDKWKIVGGLAHTLRMFR
jgi:5-methylcytosine-specific restriction endonuclease McrA